jgi:hypothetical protein
MVLMAALNSHPRSAGAVEIEGVRFSETVWAGDAELVIRGWGLLRYRVFFRAYVGAFYLPPEAETRIGQPRRLELSYFHAIKADDFAKATRAKIADNVSTKTLSELASRIERFNALYRDVRPGDRYALTYTPGRGTELSLNDVPLGLIEGDDFAEAVFAIWLGQNPIDLDFKADLLGEK